MMHRKKRARLPEFETDKDRAQYLVSTEVDLLVSLLPLSARHEMLGGRPGMLQVPSLEAQNLFIRRVITARAGNEGQKLASARLALAIIRKYGTSTLSLSDPVERDAALFPMTGILANELIFLEDQRALSEAKGAKRGATVGPRFRDTLIFMADKLLMPICVDRAVLFGAAPKATASGPTSKAGSLPIAVKCHFEFLASDNIPDHISAISRKVIRFYARTFLAANLDQSVRIGEGIRVELFPDESTPDAVMRGTAWMGKDGAPIALYAPAEGILGPYTWYRDHLNQTVELGQVYPKWEKPRGSGGALDKAGDLKVSVATKDEIRSAFKDLLGLAPLCYTTEEITTWALRGHSMHATFPDWARAIGRFPAWNFTIPRNLAMGFDGEDVQALGLWLRDAGAKSEASAEQAAREAAGRGSRRAAARAILEGLPAARGQMPVYYGLAGTSTTRFSERFIQLRVRQRLTHLVRSVISVRGGWLQLPRGPQDIGIFESVSTDARENAQGSP